MDEIKFRGTRICDNNLSGLKNEFMNLLIYFLCMYSCSFLNICLFLFIYLAHSVIKNKQNTYRVAHTYFFFYLFIYQNIYLLLLFTKYSFHIIMKSRSPYPLSYQRLAKHLDISFFLFFLFNKKYF